MDFIMLTKYSGNLPIISPIFSALVNIMGIIMDWIFRATSSIGIENIGLCIILFTIVTRILMFPMSYNQGKSQKMMNALQPEVKAIQKKYSGKTDQNSLSLQQAEIRAVYEKYGVSMTGGCGQLLLQMPIIFALYRVILNIPAYVASVKVPFQNIVTAIGGDSAIGTVQELVNNSEELTKLVKTARIPDGVIDSQDRIIDFLYHLNPSQWEQFKATFASASDVIAANYEKIQSMNQFLGIDLATSPSAYGLTSVKAWIIPLLAGGAQFLATKFMMNKQTANQGNDQMAQTMQSMNLMMPLMSIVFCFSFASGIGIYWIASSVLMGVQQYFLNKHFDKIDINDLVKKNIEKANIKRAKKGLPLIDEKSTEENYKRMLEKQAKDEAKKAEKIERSNSSVAKSDEYYELDSIANRAKMVEQFNNRKGNKK